MTNPTAGLCDCGGSGVLVTERDYGSDGDRYEIQHCDTCARFEGDEVAALWVQELLRVVGAGDESRALDGERRMFGETVAEMESAAAVLPKRTVRDWAIYVAGVLSDTQEMLARGKLETARLALNKAKYFLASKMPPEASP